MQTALLDQSLWDLVLDVNGDLAIASEPYSVAQDVACAVRTFLGEIYYDTTIGVPYFQSILGKSPSVQFLKDKFVAAALTVPGVRTARCFLSSLDRRRLSGQLQFTFSASTDDQETFDGLIIFIGSNQGIVTFFGTNGAFVNFEGST